MKKYFFLFLFFSSFIFCDAFFIPPKDWEIADPKKLSKHVDVGFIGKQKNSFRPSINLASEKTLSTLKEYVKAIKTLNQKDKNSSLRELGEINTQSGKAALLEITKKNSFGDLRLLQQVFIHKKRAYILTAAAKKEDFNGYQKEIISSLQSFKITSDLLSEIKDTQKKALLEQKIEEYKSLKNIKILQDFVLDNFNDLGPYWKILVLKKAFSDGF